MSSWKAKVQQLEGDAESRGKLEILERRLGSFEARTGAGELAGIEEENLGAYQEVFGILSKISANPTTAKRTIEAILDGIGSGER